MRDAKEEPGQEGDLAGGVELADEERRGLQRAAGEPGEAGTGPASVRVLSAGGSRIAPMRLVRA